MDYLTYFLYFLTLAPFPFLIRSTWVFNKRMNYFTYFKVWGHIQILRGFYNFEPEDYVQAIAPMEEMLWRFWIWDFERFVEDEGRYRAVMERRPPVEYPTPLSTRR